MRMISVHREGQGEDARIGRWKGVKKVREWGGKRFDNQVKIKKK